MRKTSKRRIRLAAAVAGAAAIAIAATACGGSKSTASGPPTTSSTATAATGNRTPGRGFFNRTPPPAIQTSIAEGTPRASFRNGTPPAAIRTAIAEGTRPAGFGGARLLGAVATALNINLQQLRTELQAQGATLASVAQAHGVNQATLRQDLINAEQQQLASEVSSGRMTQSDATTAQNQFNANVGQMMNTNGLGGFGRPGGGPPGASQ